MNDADADPTVQHYLARLGELEQALERIASMQEAIRLGCDALASCLQSAPEADMASAMAVPVEPPMVSGDSDDPCVLATVEALEQAMRAWERTRAPLDVLSAS